MVFELAQPESVEFGDPIFEKSLVTDRIRRAQCAIINPNKDSNFLSDTGPDELDVRHLSFSFNSLCLEITREDVDDLSPLLTSYMSNTDIQADSGLWP